MNKKVLKIITSAAVVIGTLRVKHATNLLIQSTAKIRVTVVSLF